MVVLGARPNTSGAEERGDAVTPDVPVMPARGEWPKAVPLLALVALLAYCNSFTKAFVFDDIHFIVANPDLGDAARYMGDWTGRPVVRLSVLLNHRLGGFEPAGYHALNLLVHLAAGLTLFGLVRRVLLLPRFEGRYDDAAPRLAFAVALLWLVHPLQTQAVTYIVQRCESMMGLFYLFALYAWLRGATGSGRWWYAGAVGSFALSCGCKEVAATLPPVLVAFDRVFLARSWRELARRWPAYLGILAVWGAALLPFVRTASSGEGAESGVGFTIASATPWTYLLTESEVILHYLRLSVWPTGQAFDYLDWPIARSLREVWPAFLAVSALLVASLALLYFRPAAGFVGFFFFVVLAPTSSIMPIVDPAFEHRMYLPLASVLVGLVFAGHAVLARTGWPEPKRAAFGLALAGCAAVLMLPLTFARNETYRTQLVHLEHAAAARPHNARPIASLVPQYLAAGDLARAEAAVKAGESLPNGPGLMMRHRANWLARSGRLEEAAPLYRDYLNGTPFFGFLSPQIYRVLVWVRIATGRPDFAAITARNLTRQQPLAADNWLTLSAAELAAGNDAAAREAAEEAVRLDPGVARRASEEARLLTLAADGPATRLDQAQALWQSAAACLAVSDPDPRMLDTLALAYSRAGRYADAAAAARRGLAASKFRGDDEWAQALKARLALYEAGKPYTRGGKP